VPSPPALDLPGPGPPAPAPVLRKPLSRDRQQRARAAGLTPSKEPRLPGVGRMGDTSTLERRGGTELRRAPRSASMRLDERIPILPKTPGSRAVSRSRDRSGSSLVAAMYSPAVARSRTPERRALRRRSRSWPCASPRARAAPSKASTRTAASPSRCPRCGMSERRDEVRASGRSAAEESASDLTLRLIPDSRLDAFHRARQPRPIDTRQRRHGRPDRPQLEGPHTSKRA